MLFNFEINVRAIFQGKNSMESRHKRAVIVEYFEYYGENKSGGIKQSVLSAEAFLISHPLGVAINP